MAEGSGHAAPALAEPIEQQWELPRGWQWQRLVDMLPLAYGKALPEKQRQAGNVPVFGSSGVVGTHSKSLIAQPTILVGRKGSAGSVHYSQDPCWPIDTTYYVVPRDGIDLCYGFYLLKYLRLERLDRSTAIPSLSRDVYNDILVPVAPPEVQRRIARRIGELFAEIAEGESALADARAGLDVYRKVLLRTAFAGDLTADWRKKHPARLGRCDYLKQILEDRRRAWAEDAARSRRKYIEPLSQDAGSPSEIPDSWVWASLQQITFISGGITVDRKRKPDDPIEVPYLRVANVQRGYIDLENVKTLVVGRNELDCLTLRSGDILLNEGGDRDKIGRGWVWKAELPLCIHQNHVFKARPSTNNVVPQLISLYLNELGRKFFIAEGKQTTNLASISLSKVARAPVPIPPREEAEAILAAIADVSLLTKERDELLRSSEFASSTLRQSVLSAAFRGELVR